MEHEVTLADLDHDVQRALPTRVTRASCMRERVRRVRETDDTICLVLPYDGEHAPTASARRGSYDVLEHAHRAVYRKPGVPDVVIKSRFA